MSPWLRGFKELHFSRHTLKKTKKIGVPPASILERSKRRCSAMTSSSPDAKWCFCNELSSWIRSIGILIWFPLDFPWNVGKSSANPGKTRNGILQIRHGFQFTQKNMLRVKGRKIWRDIIIWRYLFISRRTTVVMSKVVFLQVVLRIWTWYVIVQNLCVTITKAAFQEFGFQKVHSFLAISKWSKRDNERDSDSDTLW